MKMVAEYKSLKMRWTSSVHCGVYFTAFCELNVHVIIDIVTVVSLALLVRFHLVKLFTSVY